MITSRWHLCFRRLDLSGWLDQINDV